MLLTEQLSTEKLSDASASPAIFLSVHGGLPGEQLVALPSGQHSVGSGPRCSLRLQAPGVRPLHCLIHVAAAGARVRRWADDTLLNGQSFDEAPFEPGDSLTVGSTLIDYLNPRSGRDLHAPPPVDAHATSVAEARPAAEPTCGPIDVQPVVESRPATTPDLPPVLSRRRGKTLVGAVRRNRDACRQLAARVTTAEETARGAAASQRHATSQAADTIAKLNALSDQLNTDRQRLGAERSEVAAKLEELRGQLGAVRDRAHADWHQAAAQLDDLSRQFNADRNGVAADRAAATARLEGLNQQLLADRDQIGCLDGRLAAQETLTSRFQEIVAATERLSHESEELIALQERVSQEVDRLASELRTTVKQQAELPDQLTKVDARTTDVERKCADLDGRWSATQRTLEAWHGQNDQQAARIDALEARQSSAEHASVSLRDRGLKLLAVVRRSRHLGREMQSRLARVEEQLSVIAAEWRRFRDDPGGGLLASQEDQAAAWLAVTEATDHLSEKYRRLASDNARLEAQLEQFAATREELAAEKAAITDKFDQLRRELHDESNAQRDALQLEIAQFDQLQADLQQRIQDWESTRSERDEFLGRCELRLDDYDQRLASWESRLADHEPLFTRTQSQWASLDERLKASESRWADREQRISDVEAQLTVVEQRWEAGQNHVLDEVNRQHEQSVAERGAERQQLAELRSLLAQLDQRLQSVESRPEPEPPAEELANWERPLAELGATLAELRQRLASVEGRLDEDVRTQDAADWERHAAASEHSLVEFGQRLAELERKVGDDRHDQERASWQRQFAELQPILAEYARQVFELKAQIEQLFRTQEAASSSVDAGHGPFARQLPGAASESDDAGPQAAPTADQPVAWDWSASAVLESDATEAEPAAASASATSWPVDEPEASEPSADRSDAEDDSARNRPSYQPASFIDRYAHLLDEDVTDGKTLPLRHPPADAKRPGDEAHAVDAPAVPEPEPVVTDSDDEESIEQYMSQMMERIRGDSTSSSRATVPMTPRIRPEQPRSTVGGSTESWRRESAGGEALAASTDAASEVQQPPWKRGPAPEHRTNMAALRALANQSARQAIGVHSARIFRRKALLRFLFGTLSGGAGLFIAYHAPSWKSFEFGTACVALLAVVFWALQTLGAFIKAVRLGAFDDFELDDDFDEPVDESLPFDDEVGELQPPVETASEEPPLAVHADAQDAPMLFEPDPDTDEFNFDDGDEWNPPAGQ